MGVPSHAFGDIFLQASPHTGKKYNSKLHISVVVALVTQYLLYKLFGCVPVLDSRRHCSTYKAETFHEPTSTLRKLLSKFKGPEQWFQLEWSLPSEKNSH